MSVDIGPSAFSPDSATLLDEVFARCVGAYSDITLRGYRRDLEIFSDWCVLRGATIAPASPEIVAAYVDYQLVRYAYATIRRRVSAIKFLHRMCDISSPIDTSVVYLSLRRAARIKGRRSKQVRGLTADLVATIIEACPDTLIGLLDAALISVVCDTLCRSSELPWMEVGHIDLATHIAYIPLAKNDPFADGRLARLSRETVKQISQWLESSKIEEGSLFRGLARGNPNLGPMETSSIRTLIKTAARRAGVDEKIVVGLSGHSMRVGAAQGSYERWL